MKKLLGISIVAMLAVSPMMASATITQYTDPSAGQENPLASNATGVNMASKKPYYKESTITDADASHIASTAYVKGAYNSAIAAVNKAYEDATSAASTALSTADGNGIAYSNGKLNVDLATTDVGGVDTNISGLEIDSNGKLKVTAGNGIEVTSSGVAAKVDATSATLANGANGLKIADGGVGETQLANGAVTFEKVASGDIIASNSNDDAGIRAASSASDSKFVTEKAVAKALATVATVANDAQTAQEVEDAIDAAAGAGLATNGSGVLSIDLKKGTGDVDASGLDLTGDKLAVNAGSGLNIGSTGALEAKVDNSTITVDNNGALQVGTITTSNIAAGSQQAPTATGTYTNSKLATAGYVDEKAAGLQTGTLATINASTVSIFTTWGSDDGTATNTVSVAAPNSYVAQ